MGVVLAILMVWVLLRALSGRPLISVRLRRQPVRTGGEELESVRRLQEEMSGTRCWQCKEKYAGIAMDCACTNWGR